MEKELFQYGILGIVVVALSGYVLRIEGRHKKERKEWMEMQERQFDRTNDLADESNKVIREHTNLLSSLKSMLENRR